MHPIVPRGRIARRLFTLCLLLFRNRLDFSRHQMLRFEEQRTNDLLQTLLPERITIQLKQARGVAPQPCFNSFQLPGLTWSLLA